MGSVGVPARKRRVRAASDAEGRRASRFEPERLVTVALAVVVLSSALLIGGAVPKLYLPVGFFALASALVASFYVTGARAGIVPVVLLSGLGMYSLLQTVPMPVSILAKLSPATADVWSRCLLPVSQRVDSASLSLDPSASTMEAFKWSSYAATFYLSAAAGRARGLLIVFASCALVALVSFAHGLMGATTVFGLYHPERPVVPLHAGPFLNPNNLAGYLNLGALVGLGLILSRHRPATSRWTLALGLLVIVAVSLRTASRGGVVALLAGLLIFALCAVLTRGTQRIPAKVAIYASLGLLIVGAAFAIVGADSVFWSDLLSEDTQKLQLPKASVPLIKDHLWFGVGRGSFESVFQAYRPDTTLHTTFSHPENFVVQWASEWGVPVAAVAGAISLWCFWPTRVLAHRSVVALGALCGVATLLAQNLVDLGLELGGVGTAMAAVLGSLWAQARPLGDRRVKRAWTPWVVRVGLGIGILAGFLAIGRGVSTLADDRGKVHALLDRRTSDPSASEPLRDAVIAMSRRHPADYYFPLAGAIGARLDHKTPIPWIQRALERGPRIGRTHLLLGEVLADYGYARQALLELKLAVTYEPGLAHAVSRVVAPLTRDPEMILLAVPDGESGAPLLDLLARSLSKPEELAARERLDTEALARDPSLTGPRERFVEARLTGLSGSSSLCRERDACIKSVEEHADALAKFAPRSTKEVLARARLALVQADVDGAITILQKGCNRPEEQARCFRLLAETISKERPKSEALGGALDAFTSAACAEHDGCADAHAWVASVRAARAEHQLAVTSLERAAREDSSAARFLALADAAETAGLFATELNALEQARRLDPTNATIGPRIELVRQKAAAGGMSPR